jgi:hypothetical protein
MLHPPSALERSKAAGKVRAEEQGTEANQKRSLAAILQAHGPLSVRDAVDVVLDVLDELANAHANGVVHGDLGVHRVRTTWPRRPGQPVDIYALDENDTAAFEARAMAGAILVAPEQRAGRIVDARADIFSVGVILHWLLSGRAPVGAPVHRVLEKAPRQLIATIEACLADDPSRRPQSVDEVAQALGTFAASPPARFAQVAQRRAALLDPKQPRDVYEELDRTLGRLDEAALSRELSTVPRPAVQQETLVISVHSVFSQPPRPIEPELRRSYPQALPPSSQAPTRHKVTDPSISGSASAAASYSHVHPRAQAHFADPYYAQPYPPPAAYPEPPRYSEPPVYAEPVYPQPQVYDPYEQRYVDAAHGAPPGPSYATPYDARYSEPPSYVPPPYAPPPYQGEGAPDPRWGYGYEPVEGYAASAQSEHLPAPMLVDAEPRPRAPSMAPVSFETPSEPPPPPRSPWTSVFGFIATAAIVAFAVLIVARMTDRAALRNAAAAALQPAAATATPAAAPSAPPVSASASAPASPAPAGPPPASPATKSATAKTASPPVLSPSALPDARPSKASRGAGSPGKASAPSRPSRRGAARNNNADGMPTSREAPPPTEEINSSSLLNDALQ